MAVGTNAMRADAVRSRARLLKSAVKMIARDGAGVSLEAIARDAEVGSATLHRHFPTRWVLLEAIFKDRAEQIAHRADELAASNSADALATWFRDLVEMANSTSGLAAIIEPGPSDETSDGPSCHAVIAKSGERLLIAEKSFGRIRRDLEIDELMALAMSISVQPSETARQRLSDVVVNGWTTFPKP